MVTEQQRATLHEFLATAVPLWILQLQNLDDAVFRVTWRRWLVQAEASGVFAESALFASGKESRPATAFNAMAQAIAALSFLPGGCRLFGQEWISRRGAQQ